MIVFVLAGILFLGWSLGKNNLSNLFGTAVGTRMVSLNTAVGLAIIFICLGAFVSGSATTGAVLQLAPLRTMTDALVVCVTAALVLECASVIGIPASIAQTSVGSIVGWGMAYGLNQTMDWPLVWTMMSAWLVAPCLATFVSWSVMRLVRFLLKKRPVSVFKRDVVVRVGLIGAGILASYSLGANNVGTITGPLLGVAHESIPEISCVALVCAAIGAGCLQADKRVIQTVSNRLFPLSPTEALIVMVGTALTMILFTSESVRWMLYSLKLPTFPLVPVPMSSTIIGAIVGISLARGGYGLHFWVLGRIILSWILVPMLSAVFCFGLTKGVMGL